MAAGIVFSFTHCAHEITAWDDGDPYYLDELGEKHHAYHPPFCKEGIFENDPDEFMIS